MLTNLYHDDPFVAVPVVLVPSLPSCPELPVFVTVPPLFETDPPDDDPAFPALPRPERLLPRDDEIEARENKGPGVSSGARRNTVQGSKWGSVWMMKAHTAVVVVPHAVMRHQHDGQRVPSKGPVRSRIDVSGDVVWAKHHPRRHGEIQGAGGG